MAVRHREEVLNTVLAEVILARGMNASPESLLDHGKARPDVIIGFRGLRCVIEGKVGDVADAKALVTGDAAKRVEKGIAHLAVAVVYPSELRSTAFNELPGALANSQLDFAVCTERGWSEWREGGVNEVLAELRRAQEKLVEDDLVQEVASKLEAGLQEVAQILFEEPAACDRLIGLLGIGEPAHEEGE